MSSVTCLVLLILVMLGFGGNIIPIAEGATDDLIVPFCTSFVPDQMECFDEADTYRDYPEDRLCFRGVSGVCFVISKRVN